jgi:CDP-glucose 4,6-dehydratase
VAALVETLQKALGASSGWVQDTRQRPPEKQFLTLEPSLARQVLGWRERLPDRAAIEATAAWYKALSAGADMRAVTLKAIEDYVSR